MKRNFIYLDTEFIRHDTGIELVSIALVKPTGEEYYAISADYNPELASEWVQENVFPHLEPDLPRKTLAQIAEEILAFVGHQVGEFWGYLAYYDWWLVLQLFRGEMQRLPYNLPIYCKELKQEIDRLRPQNLPARPAKHHALLDAHWCRQVHAALQEMEGL